MISPTSPLPNSGFSRFSHLEKYPDHRNLFKAVDKLTLAPILIKRTKNFALSSKNIELARKLQPILYELDHRCIVKPIDYLLERRDLYSILEYIPNSATVSTVINQRAVTNFVNLPVLDTTEIFDITNQLLSALQYLHEHPLGTIVFHAVNCDNIVLTGDGSSIACKLLDFAEAMTVDGTMNGGKSPSKSPRSSTSSFSSSSIETSLSDYASPERQRNIMGLNQLSEMVDSSSDMWSLGATLLAVATSLKLSDLPAHIKQAMLFGYDDWSFEKDIIGSMSEKQLFLWRRQEEFVRLVIARCLRLTPADRPSATSLLNLNDILQSIPPKSPVRKTPTSQTRDNSWTPKSRKETTKKQSSTSKKLFATPSPSSSLSKSLQPPNMVESFMEYPRSEPYEKKFNNRYQNIEEDSTRYSSTSMKDETFTYDPHDNEITSASFVTAIDASESIVAQSLHRLSLPSTPSIVSSPPSLAEPPPQQQRPNLALPSPCISKTLQKEEENHSNEDHHIIIESFQHKLSLQKRHSGIVDDPNRASFTTSVGSVTSVESPISSDSSLTSIINMTAGPTVAMVTTSFPTRAVSLVSGNTRDSIDMTSTGSKAVDSESHKPRSNTPVQQIDQTNQSSTESIPQIISDANHPYRTERTMIEFPSFSVSCLCWITLHPPLSLLTTATDCLPYILLATNGRMANTIDLWRFDRDGNVRCLLTLTGHSDAVMSLSPLTSDGGLLSTSQDGTARIWHVSHVSPSELDSYCDYILQSKVEKEEEKEEEEDTAGGALLAATQTHWYGRIVTGSRKGGISVWDPTVVSHPSDTDDTTTAVLTPLCHLRGHTDSVTSFAVISDVRIVSASLDRTLRMWQLETRQCLHVFRGHSQGVTAVVACHNGQHLLSAGHDELLRVWDVTLKTGVYMVQHPHSLPHSPAHLPANATNESHHSRPCVAAMTLLSDAQTLALVGNKDGCVSLWSVDMHSDTTQVPRPTLRQELRSRWLSSEQCACVEMPRRLAAVHVKKLRRDTHHTTGQGCDTTGPLLVAGSGRNTDCSLVCWT